MTLVHILRTPGEYTDWRNTCERWPEAKDRGRCVVTDCCNRLVTPEETKSRIFEPVLFDEDGEPTAGAYMGGWTQYHCLEGVGCTVNHGMKRTAHLREGWYDPCY